MTEYTKKAAEAAAKALCTYQLPIEWDNIAVNLRDVFRAEAFVALTAAAEQQAREMGDVEKGADVMFAATQAEPSERPIEECADVIGETMRWIALPLEPSEEDMEASAKEVFCQHFAQELWGAAACKERFVEDSRISLRTAYAIDGRAAAQDGWQDVASAPKDGSEIILFTPSKYSDGVSIGRWYEDKYAKKPRPYWSRRGSMRITSDCESIPTHWRPLPAPPRTGDE